MKHGSNSTGRDGPSLIGTRGSLLARAQADLVRERLQDLTGESFQLKTIATEGDRNTQAALWQLPGQDFFTKELDAALLASDIDMAIHSYKDLGHQRPPGVALAAITERAHGEDILLLTRQTRQQLDSLSSFVVGSSSPRRVACVQRYLAPLLPVRPQLSVTGKVLRGNINTRLEKLRDGRYHAIVLALAGLERLAQHAPSRLQLQALLKDLDYMILPSSSFPSAAAQGALAIEVNSQRKDGGQLQALLQKLHHVPTAQVVEREREHFQRYGGGCHLAVGIQVEEVAGEFVHCQRGEVEGREVVERTIEGWRPPASARPFLFGTSPREKSPARAVSPRPTGGQNSNPSEGDRGR